MNKKTRLDSHMAAMGFSKSREQAKREIISGWVKVNGETIREPSRLVKGDEEIFVERPGGRFVSRGGGKLHKALKVFNIDIHGKVAADLGASTGGFTDCMLTEGALLVYAVDVGYGQFDYALRNDNRVVLKERTNVKDLTRGDFDREIDFITADLSFISILKVYEKIRDVFQKAEGIILIKPQFEALKSEHKKGVVRKSETHKAILKRILVPLTEQGMILIGLTYSPIKGPSGNIEFLIHFKNYSISGEEKIGVGEMEELINKTVDDAHNEFSSPGR